MGGEREIKNVKKKRRIKKVGTTLEVKKQEKEKKNQMVGSLLRSNGQI